MSGYDNWQDERDRLHDALEANLRERVIGLIDHAAKSAKLSNLAEAAPQIEEARRILVMSGLFGRWDNGIWVFSSLIRLIRAMSPETQVPSDYQRLLDAIPSARYDAQLNREQTRFWYGSKMEKHSEIWISAAVLAAILATIVYLQWE
jgi:hypothetical protein